MIFTGTKKSILLLGRLLIAAAQCRYDKSMLQHFLGLRNNDDVQIYIRQGIRKPGLEKIRGKEQSFSWTVPADLWKTFSRTLAQLRSGKINGSFNAQHQEFDLVITLGNRL